jgi:hypothetical protein
LEKLQKAHSNAQNHQEYIHKQREITLLKEIEEQKLRFERDRQLLKHQLLTAEESQSR